MSELSIEQRARALRRRIDLLGAAMRRESELDGEEQAGISGDFHVLNADWQRFREATGGRGYEDIDDGMQELVRLATGKVNRGVGT